MGPIKKSLKNMASKYESSGFAVLSNMNKHDRMELASNPSDGNIPVSDEEENINNNQNSAFYKTESRG